MNVAQLMITYILQAPLLGAYLVGMLLAVAFRRYRAAAALVFAGCLVLLLTHVAVQQVTYSAMASRGARASAYVGMVSMIGTFAQGIGTGLLIAAALVGRRNQA